MNFLQKIFGGSKEIELQTNPDIIVNFCSGKHGIGHAILVCKNYIVNDSFVSSRRCYSCLPRDLDENMDDDMMELSRNRLIDIPVKRGFFDVFGKGTLSNQRTIVFLFPSNPDDLPDSMKGTWVSDVILKKQITRNFIEQMKQKDVDMAKLYEQTLSVYGEYLKRDLESMNDKLKKVVSDNQVEKK